MNVDASIETNEAGTMIFRGIRVRMGIHYGAVEAVYDEVSKGYDYYGDTVNTAARVESVGFGGQILITEDVVTAAGDALDKSGDLELICIACPAQGHHRSGQDPRAGHLLHASRFPNHRRHCPDGQNSP